MNQQNDQTVQKFDFSPLIEALTPYLGVHNGETTQNSENATSFQKPFGTGNFILESPLFAEYAAWYFGQDFMRIAQSDHIRDDLPKLTSGFRKFTPYERYWLDDGQESNQSTLRHNNKNKTARPTTIFPLTYAETMQALDFIENNPAYLLTMAAIKACIVQYYIDMRNAVEDAFKINFMFPSPTDSEHKKEVGTAFGAALTNARSSLAIPHDLTTQLAGHLAKTEIGSPFTPAPIVQAFKTMFNRSAFQSYNEQGIYKACPFKTALTGMLRTGLAYNDDGTLMPLPQQTPGRLILDVRDIVLSSYAPDAAVTRGISPAI